MGGFSSYSTIGGTPPHNPEDCEVELFDYTSDLNAMHEVEKWISSKHSTIKWVDYAAHLRVIADRDDGICYAEYRATAAQRAEAFLRTIGKWEDGE